MKKALITGITGQDGSYLAEFLLDKGYHVYGVIRRTSLFKRHRIEHLYLFDGQHNDRLKLMYGDLNDASSLNRILEKVKPDEIYNLAAQSHVGISFQMPEYTTNVNALGIIRLLDAIKEVKLKTKFYQASSSEIFGSFPAKSQSEATPFHPRSPYACAKAFSFYITQNYREAYGMFICNGFLFNHESPRRSENFVSRKITMSLARMKFGLQKKLLLGNLNARRDWGYAKDYVEAMWLMLQQPKPDDYVIATGENHSVREFAELAAKGIGIDLIWKGKGLNEKGIDRRTKKTIIEVDPDYFRPTDVETLLGNPDKAVKKLGWKPKKTLFKELIRMMMESDLKLAEHEALGRRMGIKYG
ncbi:MAG: GDP-mannose 4,6-dehydratase [Candidatus Omnitrophica bacterium]|nr:GDP-mannose 4,6-dehydratase [Candidatus Omnitrophota bacterium]